MRRNHEVPAFPKLLDVVSVDVSLFNWCWFGDICTYPSLKEARNEWGVIIVCKWAVSYAYKYLTCLVKNVNWSVSTQPALRLLSTSCSKPLHPPAFANKVYSEKCPTQFFINRCDYTVKAQVSRYGKHNVSKKLQLLVGAILVKKYVELGPAR